MTARETARYIGESSSRAARETRAFRRGHVVEFAADGRAIVQLPNGAKILMANSSLEPASPGQGVQLISSGAALELYAVSPYGGGLGEPYAPPEP